MGQIGFLHRECINKGLFLLQKDLRGWTPDAGRDTLMGPHASRALGKNQNLPAEAKGKEKTCLSLQSYLLLF